MLGFKKSPAQLILQILGGAVGIALLIWAIRSALSEHNRASLDAIRNAPIWIAAALLGLSALSVFVNSLLFWATVRPIQRLSVVGVIATNTLATLFAVLPFKIGFLTRCVVHHRRDGVPLKDLIAWFAAMSALALAVFLPLGFAGFLRGTIDLWWWVIVIAGGSACSIVGVAAGRLSMRDNHFGRWLARLSLGSWRIVRFWKIVVAHVALRWADAGVLSARFLAAAMIAGVTIDPGHAVLLGSTYFLLSVLAPAGVLGFREAGTAFVAGIIGLNVETIALLSLIVTVAETLTCAVLAIPAWIMIRPDRLFAARKAERQHP